MSDLIGPLDTFTGRGEFWNSLHRLPPVSRLTLLIWACQQSPKAMFVPEPGPQMREMCQKALSGRAEADTAFTSEVYADLCSLSVYWGVSLEKVAVRLDQMLRGL